MGVALKGFKGPECGGPIDVGILCGRFEIPRWKGRAAQMKVIESLRLKLEKAFSPVQLDINDESHLHAGHAGARPGGESHFSLEITAAVFAGKSRVARQRLVYQTLAEELAGPVHALSIKALAPDERLDC